ncbi:UNVERIFIED_ORG: hypothetical protein J2W87_000958 [Pseudomonas putida]|nr:hypothetical protein [Pseudomonas putida]
MFSIVQLRAVNLGLSLVEPDRLSTEHYRNLRYF